MPEATHLASPAEKSERAAVDALGVAPAFRRAGRALRTSPQASGMRPREASCTCADLDKVPYDLTKT